MIEKFCIAWNVYGNSATWLTFLLHMSKGSYDGRELIIGVSEKGKKLDHSDFADRNDNGTATLKPSLVIGKTVQ